MRKIIIKDDKEENSRSRSVTGCRLDELMAFQMGKQEVNKIKNIHVKKAHSEK